MGTRPKVILRKKILGILKSFPPKMGEKCKIISELKKLCAWCCLILIFLGVMQNYPRKNISKIQDKVFEYFGEKLISLFLPVGLGSGNREHMDFWAPI